MSSHPTSKPTPTRAAVARALRPVQLALLTVGATSLAVYGAARVHGVVGKARALESFALAQNIREADAPSPGNGPAPAVARGLPGVATPDQSLWGSTRIAAYRSSQSAAIGAPLGVLSIAKLGLDVPIFEGTSDLTLNRGVGRIEGTAGLSEQGNLGIAGHRDGFFRGLKDVKVGDAIDVQSLDGAQRYRVTEILIVEPTDVYVLDPTESATLTLVTCYPFYFIGDAPQRYIVKAVAAAAAG